MPRALTLILAALLSAALAIPAAAAANDLPDVSAAAVATAAAQEADDATSLLVRLQPGADADAVHARAGGRFLRRIGGINVDVVAVPRSNVATAVTAYKGSSDVVYV